MSFASSVERAGRTAWHLLGLAAAVGLAAWLSWQVRLVLLPLFVAALISIILTPVARAFRLARSPRGLAALGAVVVFLAALTTVGVLVVPPLVEQLASLGDTLDDAAGRLERWVERERPFGFDGSDVRAAIARATDVDRPSTEVLVTGAQAVAEVVAGLLFAIVATFFLLRDGPRMREWTVGLLAHDRRDDGRAVIDAVVGAVTGYVRGSALLGGIEAVTIGAVVAVVGGDLPVLLAVLTFVAAFVPLVGAVIAGMLAVAVTLVSAGTGPAITVAVVAVVVQQFDGDLLAPLVFGRFLQLHPLAVLASISVGVRVAGILGAFAGVPIAASVVAVTRVLARRRRQRRLDPQHPPAREALATVGDPGRASLTHRPEPPP